MLVVFVAHFATISRSPPIWQDEVQIVDFGRQFLTTDSSWSLNWVAEIGRPIRGLFYLGGVIQEGAFRVAGQSLYGPRVCSLLGALLAATLAAAWLLQRGISNRMAWIMGMVFLLDPVFVQNYRGGRVDAWAIALILGACVLVRREEQLNRAEGRCLQWRLLAAGFLTTLSVFVWVSAVFLWLLALVDLASLGYSTCPKEKRMRPLLSVASGFSIGCVIGLLVLSIPIAPNLKGLVGDFLYVVKLVAVAPSDNVTWFRRMLVGAGEFVGVFALSPFLLLAAVWGCCARKRAGLAIVTVTVSLLMILSRPYVHRMVYLLPYFVLLCSYALKDLSHISFHPKLRWLKVSIPLLLVLWAGGLSLIVRPLVSVREWQIRDPARLTRMAEAQIGAGPKCVWVNAWAFYYDGRRLQWKMFRPYCDIYSIDAPQFKHFLSGLDVAIFDRSPDESLIKQLEAAGLKLSETSLDDNSPAGGAARALKKWGASGYGKYYFFRRDS